MMEVTKETALQCYNTVLKLSLYNSETVPTVMKQGQHI